MGCGASSDALPQEPLSTYRCTLCDDLVPVRQLRRNPCGHRFHRSCLIALALGGAGCPHDRCAVPATDKQKRSLAGMYRPIDDALVYTTCKGSAVLDDAALMPGRASHDSDSASDASTGETCTICQDGYGGSDKLAKLPCGHLLHAECADEWLVHKRECPLCRAPAHPPKLPAEARNIVALVQQVAAKQLKEAAAAAESDASSHTSSDAARTPSLTPGETPGVTPRVIDVIPAAITS